MAENFAFVLFGTKISKHNGDTPILLIDHDTASIASLTPMLKQHSYKVISVNVASEAVSMLEKQKDIVLVIANNEMPHIDSHSFYTSLLTKDIPLILISSEGKRNKSSNSLEKRACYFLTRPIHEKDINNMLQHVLPNKSQKLEKISIPNNAEALLRINQMKAFRENLRRQRTEVNNIESKVRRCSNLWTYSHPKSILSIMNVPNLTHREVARHLQSYKAKVDRMNETLSRKEWIPTNKTFEYPSDYKYPFTLSNIAKNLFSGGQMDLSNSQWQRSRRIPLCLTLVVPLSVLSPADELHCTSARSGEILDVSTRVSHLTKL
ncbi:hypothetical protein BRARA_G02786 [Brassica rapa]|uniref:Response regulatory domain-containing protein n=1 Tax=Brassica campestris TaxID=3711 RepID=A0A397YQ43_BRACM|nr:hypothetical protein BRARA_G02786 [Brassica rapa]